MQGQKAQEAFAVLNVLQSLEPSKREPAPVLVTNIRSKLPAHERGVPTYSLCTLTTYVSHRSHHIADLEERVQAATALLQLSSQHSCNLLRVLTQSLPTPCNAYLAALGEHIQQLPFTLRADLHSVGCMHPCQWVAHLGVRLVRCLVVSAAVQHCGSTDAAKCDKCEQQAIMWMAC